jgi:hypothetical protein
MDNRYRGFVETQPRIATLVWSVGQNAALQ